LRFSKKSLECALVVREKPRLNRQQTSENKRLTEAKNMIICCLLIRRALSHFRSTLFKNEASGTFMWALAGWFVALHFFSKKAVSQQNIKASDSSRFRLILELNYSFEP
jgi:hypothetical protein